MKFYELLHQVVFATALVATTTVTTSARPESRNVVPFRSTDS